jgi:HSP20 family molecular chaperone IbpA
LVEVALPGVVLDDVEIKAEEHFLTIQAKRLPVAFEEDALIHIQEMPFSYLLREFEFFAPIVTEQIEARMDRGILYISVPKLEVTHRIPVSAGMIESRLPGLKTQIISKTDSSRHNKEVVSK